MNLEWKTSSEYISYPDALAFMKAYVKGIQNGENTNLVWLLEHSSLFTRGFRTEDNHFISPTFPIFSTNRGGEATYHGPGQRIAYIMLNLKHYVCDVKKYVFFLEEWVIQTLALWGIKGHHRPGKIGVWVETSQGDKKICAIGVSVQRWVTSHGIALNVHNDLSPYTQIIPCGLPFSAVTSLKDLGIHLTLQEVDNGLKKTMGTVMDHVFKQSA